MQLFSKSGERAKWRELWDALHRFFESPLNGLIAGVVAVAVLSVSFVVAEELNIRASTTKFCVSCHSMNAYLYEEYKKSKHYQTVSGVRAQCGDCHVRKQFWPAVWDHLMGTEDLIGEFARDWTDPEVMKKHRPAMAEKVRLTMLGNDSQNCRFCHLEEAIKPKRKRGKGAHKAALKDGDTCIACHYNLVHEPVDPSPRFEKAMENYPRRHAKPDRQ
ncbi:MAG: NapC/NirT family cytochrome c [Rhodospirillales bacterium]|nr:NapC/NirT family cytochrome c [Alphaproteobacteria bacterium]MBL6947035.1 NapC/NirT family cytochrome c [Rhodospirillales bacterium]